MEPLMTMACFITIFIAAGTFDLKTSSISEENLSTFYQLLYQLFTNGLSTFYQLFINFLSIFINFYQLYQLFYQLLNKLLNQFLCCQTWSHATYCQMIVAACLLFCGLAGECVEQLHGSAMDAFEWWLKPSWFKPWFCLACEEFRCSGVQVFIVTCHV